MPSLHVCPLSLLHRTVEEARASHIVTLISSPKPVERPASVLADRHLLIQIADIAEPMDGMILPGRRHVEQLLAFVSELGARALKRVHFSERERMTFEEIETAARVEFP